MEGDTDSMENGGNKRNETIEKKIDIIMVEVQKILNFKLQIKIQKKRMEKII